MSVDKVKLLTAHLRLQPKPGNFQNKIQESEVLLWTIYFGKNHANGM